MAFGTTTETEKLCCDLCRYSAILSQCTDLRVIQALKALISETEKRVFAIEEAAEREEPYAI
jgi:hypothetical protein